MNRLSKLVVLLVVAAAMASLLGGGKNNAASLKHISTGGVPRSGWATADRRPARPRRLERWAGYRCDTFSTPSSIPSGSPGMCAGSRRSMSAWRTAAGEA